jgi:5-methyltetrahydrofolate--homocysteine methyltransferase
VAGSIGPTGFLPSSDDPTLSDISFEHLVATFAEQAQALVEQWIASQRAEVPA